MKVTTIMVTVLVIVALLVASHGCSTSTSMLSYPGRNLQTATPTLWDGGGFIGFYDPPLFYTTPIPKQGKKRLD